MTDQGSSSKLSNPAEGKGKGKAADEVVQDVSMGEEEDSSDEETGAEEEVSISTSKPLPEPGGFC